MAYLRILIAPLVMLPTVPGPAHARVAVLQTRIEPGSPMQPPRGYAELCLHQQDLCSRMRQASARGIVPVVLAIAKRSTAMLTGVDPREVATDLPSAADDRLLQHVNRRVNRAVIQRADPGAAAGVDEWTRSGTHRGAAGDCEDIAIEKRLRLIEAGMAPKHLTFAVVYSREAGLHLLLVARTASGDRILDSRSDRLLTIDGLPYRWISVQAWSRPDQWAQPVIGTAPPLA